VPGLPKEQTTTTRLEKIGTAFDVIFFVLGVAALVMTIIQFAQSEAALEKAIDDTKESVKKAKEQASQISDAEAKFFRDMPSTFLLIRAQLTQITQIAAASKLIRTEQTQRDKPLDKMIELANSYLGFTEDEFTFMNTEVTKLNDLDKLPAGEDKTAKIQQIWKDVEKKIPSDRFVAQFKQTPKIYEQLSLILEVSFDNFNFVNSMVTAIKTIRNLVPASHLPLATLALVIAPILHVDKVPDDMPLNIIALYSDFNGDTYETTNDCKKIRDANKTIDKDAWKKWVDDVTKSNQAQA